MPPRYYSRYGPYSEVAPSELQGGMGAGPALSRLYSSTEYQQANPKRKRQMEEMVAGGFHSGVKPSSIIYGKFNAFGKRDAYAPVPLAWGTWGPMTTGGVSSTGTLEGAKRGLGAVLPRSQREQQAALMAKQAAAIQEKLTSETKIQKTELGDSGSPIAFTGFGEMARKQNEEIIKPKSIFGSSGVSSLTGFGGVPMFPFSNY